jgi:2-polyprenyl-3-methyl-5-hydroxy-6-metoxy-1,4-benzoquinol methylase
MKNHFREFYELVGREYPEDRIVYETLSGHLRKQWICEKLCQLPPGNLLDCGCNIGTLSREWIKGPVFGVDISYAVLKRGKEHAPHTNFMLADLRDLTMIKKNSIDNAMACEVIEHLDKPYNFLKYLYEVLKKDGKVLITSPNYTHSRPKLVPLGVMRSFGVAQGTDGTQYLHTAYRPEELAAMAEQAGFEVLKMGSFEHEMRGWLKPLTIAQQLLVSVGSRHFVESRMYYLVEHFISIIQRNLFIILNSFGFGRLLKKIFKEGRRSYILAIK